MCHFDVGHLLVWYKINLPFDTDDDLYNKSATGKDILNHVLPTIHRQSHYRFKTIIEILG